MMIFWKTIEVLSHFGFSLQETLSKFVENEWKPNWNWIRCSKRALLGF